MKKREIYEQVVRLTREVKNTGIVEKIFDFAEKGDVSSIDIIFNAFPVYYPKLYQEIKSFGESFNTLVGDTPEEEEALKFIEDKGGLLINNLALHGYIGEISKALSNYDLDKLLEIGENIIEKTKVVELLIEIDKKAKQVLKTSGLDGQIFAMEANEEKELFAYDSNEIDPLSFFVFNILADVSDVYYFYYYEDDEVESTEYDPEDFEKTPADIYSDAVEKAANECFAEFVANYNFVDWIGRDEYDTIGKLLVAAVQGTFELVSEDDQ